MKSAFFSLPVNLYANLVIKLLAVIAF